MTAKTPDLAYKLANDMARHIIGEEFLSGEDEACTTCVGMAADIIRQAQEQARREEREACARAAEARHVVDFGNGTHWSIVLTGPEAAQAIRDRQDSGEG